MFYLEMILLAFIVAFIVDVSGFVGSVKPGINAVLHRDPEARLMPFDCSLCVCFWTGIGLCAFRGFTLPHIAFVCLCSYCERFFTESVFLFGATVSSLLWFIENKLNNGKDN